MLLLDYTFTDLGVHLSTAIVSRSHHLSVLLKVALSSAQIYLGIALCQQPVTCLVQLGRLLFRSFIRLFFKSALPCCRNSKKNHIQAHASSACWYFDNLRLFSSFSGQSSSYPPSASVLFSASAPVVVK